MSSAEVEMWKIDAKNVLTNKFALSIGPVPLRKMM